MPDIFDGAKKLDIEKAKNGKRKDLIESVTHILESAGVDAKTSEAILSMNGSIDRLAENMYKLNSVVLDNNKSSAALVDNIRSVMAEFVCCVESGKEMNDAYLKKIESIVDLFIKNNEKKKTILAEEKQKNSIGYKVTVVRDDYGLISSFTMVAV